MKLVKELGFGTLQNLEDSISYRDVSYWYEFYNRSPFMEDRIEVQLATISQLISSFGGSKAKHSDFMVSKQNKKEMTLKDKQDSIKAKFAMFS